MAKAYRDLIVWQRAIDLTVVIYELSDDFPQTEKYGLQSQIRRAAVSIASNIAEGSARATRRDFKQFVSVSRGSNYELQTQLIIAKRLQMVAEQRFANAMGLSEEIGKMLSKLEAYLSGRATDN